MPEDNTLKFYLALAGLTALTAGLGLFWYGTRVETRRYRLEHLKVKTGVKNGPGNTSSSDTTCSALKILHISDLHLSGNDDEKVQFIRSITSTEYDLIILTGDIFEFLDGLKYGPSLISRQPRLGAYAVFGNHDYYDYSIFNKTYGRIDRKYRQPEQRNNVEPHRMALEAGGFKVLRNECVNLPGSNLFIVGIDYPGIEEEKLAALMKQAPANALKLGLFHIPRKLDMLSRAGFDIAFGGHTHGGQVRLPGIGALITDSELARQDASGVIDVGDTKIHISRGVGADPRSNIRLFCPPAATVIDLEHTARKSVLDAPALEGSSH